MAPRVLPTPRGPAHKEKLMDDRSVNPAVRAGDGFAYAGAKKRQHAPAEYGAYLDKLRQADDRRRSCPACFRGHVTITVEEDGEEHAEAVRCRGCSDPR